MKTDRYLRIILTIIAIELLWIGVRDAAPPVAAQAAPARVVIASVDGGFLPVALAGQTADAGGNPLRPIQVGITGNVAVTARAPLKV